MKFQLLLSFFLLLLLLLPDATAQRTTYNFNNDWQVHMGDAKGAEAPNFQDASWKKVTLPWAWNEDDAFKKDIVDHSTGIAWYRKHFKLPAAARGQKVFLEFEGIRQAGDFYLNGKHIGLHENGITAFGFDVTDLVNFKGENVLAARIDNDWDYKEKATDTSYQWENKNFNANFGGIQKNVYLHLTDKLYQTLPLYTNLGTTGVYVYAQEFDIPGKAATITAASEVKNEHNKARKVQYEVVVEDMQGKKIKSFTGDKTTIAPGETKTVQASARVSDLNFWSWGYGYLYNVYTTLKVDGKPVDEVKTRTGFRKTEFKNGMFYLNDRVLMIHGYAQRTSNEWPAVGMSVPAWLSDYSNSLMVKSNGNLVRWMHITPWKQDVESCDRVGLLQAMPAGDAEKDVDGVRWSQRTAVMRDAIIYNRNNPSIIFYESGNESISEEHMQEMVAIRDKYDPYGGRAAGSREMLDSKIAEYGGEMLYINKSAHIPMWAMEYSRDEGLRKYWDEFSPPYHKDGAGPQEYKSAMTNEILKRNDAYLYNRNQDSHAKENVIRWFDYWKERPGTGRRVSSGGVNIVFSDTNTHYRGAENYRRSGEVDPMRIPKDGYFAHQVMWDGWVDVENPRIHIIGHWNYEPGIKKPIYVVSSADKVELKVNGKSLGYGTQSHRFLFTFDKVEFQPGTLSAVGYNTSGKELCLAQKITAGQPAALRLKAITHPKGLQADGHDLALIEVEVTDAQGNRCPTALNLVNFTLDGPAEWRGGIAQGPDNYILSKSLPVEGGVNRVLVRSTTKAGKISIKATAAGLEAAAEEIISVPVKVNDGLAKVLPGENLPSYLERGPTPLTPSYKVTRTPVAIVKATAGANQDKAKNSFDDNELTDWYNDGSLATAWLEYELEREAMVSEVTLKLNNFRTRTYPLVITVDGKEVFNGTTDKSLGYWTTTFKPQKGRNVRIQLAGSATAEENLQVEVSGKKLDDGVARDDSKAKGTLSIIEAEVFEPAAAGL